MLEHVKVRECACPGAPHNGEGDWVALAPTLSLEGGLVAESILRDVQTIANPEERGEVLNRRWIIAFVKYGAQGWNFEGPEGPLPFDVDAVLADYSIARLVAEKASDLGYADAVIRPFLTRQAARSPTGRTAATTSARQRRTASPSRLSSPATSADTPPSVP